MHHSNFRDEAESNNRFMAGEVPPISETLHDQTRIAASSPSASSGYNPYTLVLRVVSILFLLGLLFVAAIYYGVINP